MRKKVKYKEMNLLQKSSADLTFFLNERLFFQSRKIIFEKKGENGLFQDEKLYMSFLTEEETDIRLYFKFGGVLKSNTAAKSPLKEKEAPKTLESMKTFIRRQPKEEMPIFRLPTEILNSRISKKDSLYILNILRF